VASRPRGRSGCPGHGLRAARRLWARIIRDEFGAREDDTLKLKMIAGGGGAGLTVEALTAGMEKRIVAKLKRVDEEWGGIVAAVRVGPVQQAVARQAYETERRVQSGELVKVGVNKHRRPDAGLPAVELHPYRPASPSSRGSRT